MATDRPTEWLADDKYSKQTLVFGVQLKWDSKRLAGSATISHLEISAITRMSSMRNFARGGGNQEI